MKVFRCGLGIDEPKDDSGFLDGGEGAADANLFNLVCGLTDAGGVDESEGDSVKVDSILNRVPGCSVYG